MKAGDRIVVAFDGVLLPAHVMVVYEVVPRMGFTAKLLNPMRNKNRVALFYEDEGILWMHGESPVEVEGPFRVASALSGKQPELF